jgi:FMN-dependent NADH-azoreductase
MSYLLHIDVSPFGDNSNSKPVAAAFSAAYRTAHPGETVVTRDLAKSPLDHLDSESIYAGFTPEDARSESMKKKDSLRIELIDEIIGAKAVVISTPMWNWAIPSVLKAYIDQIIYKGRLFPHGHQLLAGKAITIVVATGSSYVGEGAAHPEMDHITSYLRLIFTVLGSTDVEFIYAENTMAGVVPGMEALIPAKELSKANALSSAEKRAKAIV